jgi:hypothetical protein
MAAIDQSLASQPGHLDPHPGELEDGPAFSIEDEDVDCRSEELAEGVAYDLSGVLPTGARSES